MIGTVNGGFTLALSNGDILNYAGLDILNEISKEITNKITAEISVKEMRFSAVTALDLAIVAKEQFNPDAIRRLSYCLGNM